MKGSDMSEAQADTEMPRYQSHKIVHALKVAEVRRRPRTDDEESDGAWMILPSEEGYLPIIVSDEYMTKHNPQAGGYYVVYADGYKSWSPAEAFEEGYTRV